MKTNTLPDSKKHWIMNICKHMRVLNFVIFLLCCDCASAERNPRDGKTAGNS